MYRQEIRRSYVILIDLHAKNITMEKAVLKNALLGTIVSATTRATVKDSCLACRAGRGNTVMNQSVWRAAVRGMETAPDLASVCVERVGRGHFVTSVKSTQPVNMVRVSSHGSATVKRAGEDFSVTKTLTSALTTVHV